MMGAGGGGAVAPEERARQLEIRLFGGLDINVNGSPLGGSVTRKAKGLLAYLAVEADRSHRRQVLAEMFWPDKPQGTARNNLRQALLALRSALADGASDRPFLLPTAEAIQFNLDSPFYLDTRHFEQLIQASKSHNHTLLLDCARCEDRLRRAVDCYRDDFLVDASLPDIPEFDVWVVTRREKYRRQTSRALRTLISMHEARNEHREASQLARKLVALEPWVEARHRTLMRALARAGMRSAAMKQYKTCKRMLAAEFGADPSRETTELYDAIREERLTVVRDEPSLVIATDAGAEPHSNRGPERAKGLDNIHPWHVGIALALFGAGALILSGGSPGRRADPAESGNDALVVGTDSGVHIAGTVEYDTFWFSGFPSDASITLSIYETSAKRNELWHGTVIAEEDVIQGTEGDIAIDWWVHGVDLLPGNMIAVSDGNIEGELILERVTVDIFDAKADIMAGTAPPDRLVWVEARSGIDGPQWHTVGAHSDPLTGEWIVDFASRGVDIKEVWREWSFAWVFDAEGDASEGFAAFAGSQ